MYNYLEKLNAEQRKAATTLEGKVFILAGAGSGKTATLTARTAYMVDTGINPENILLLTFTNKAAKEMKDRIQNMVAKDPDKITACTFHSFCAAVLRKHAGILGLKNNFTIIDSPDMVDAISICKEMFLSAAKAKGMEYDLKSFPKAKGIASVYECSVNNCVSAEEVVESNNYRDEILEILKIFRDYKKDRNLLDYDDLLFYTNKLLKENKHVKDVISDSYHYVSCDEYQDTNTIQNEILGFLSSVHGNLAVVGDDNQSIYAFRYANINNILGFKETYPDCCTIVLDTNYRSSQEILDFSNSVMFYAKEGIPKIMKGTFNGKKPIVKRVSSCYEEADFIIDKIRESQYELKNIAVICRSSMQSYILESKLNIMGVPYNKFGGLKFLEKAAIKDILAFLRLTENITDELAAYRVLQLYPGIGKTFAQRISNEIATKGIGSVLNTYKKRAFIIYLEEFGEVIDKLTGKSLNTQLKSLIKYYPALVERCIENEKTNDAKKSEELANLENAMDDLNTLAAMAKDYSTTEKFLSDIVLDATVDKDNDDKLNITTIHSAKGLEYDMVFVMDCIEGVTPKCEEDAEENAEELRCFYVAITRAKYELYLMIPARYNLMNMAGVPSHFIDKPGILR